MRKYQFVSWFPDFCGFGFGKKKKAIALIYDWSIWLGFWEIRKWHELKEGDIEKYNKESMGGQMTGGKSPRQIILSVPGKPIAKKRPRFYRKGNFVGTYNDQTTEEGRWMLEAKQQITSPLLEGPLCLDIQFLMPIPKGWPKYQIEKIYRGDFIYHEKKPDLDNLVKFVKDCLNGLAWKDDSQVAEIHAVKFYADKPLTYLLIEKK